MNEDIRKLLERERVARVRAINLREQAKQLDRHADDLRLRAWRMQRREFQRKFEEVNHEAA